MENDERKKLTEYRKNILQAIDNGKHVNINNIVFSGLTTYISEDERNEFDNSFIEKSIYLNTFNLKTEIKHLSTETHKKYFMPKQYAYLLKIEKYENIIIAAPTSFGKTLLVKEHIFRNEYSNIVYIVPTNALAYELEKSFKENPNFSSDKFVIYDSDQTEGIEKKEDTKCKIFIGTQEKYSEISDELGSIDLFVIDEAYKLKDNVDNVRCYILAQAFLDSITSKCSKTILLSPNGKFIGFEDYGFQILETRFNAVEKNIKQLTTSDNYFSNLNEKARKEKTLLFFKSPHTMEKYIDKISYFNSVDEGYLKFVRQVEGDFHPEWSVVKYLKKGVLVHTGLMPKYIQNKMINYYLDNDRFNLILGTSSLSEGINTPTKNIFFEKNYVFKENEMLVKNTIGRAGRLGKYPIGNIYFYSEDKDNVLMINTDTAIELCVSKEEQLEEVDSEINDRKLRDYCTVKNIDFTCLKEILKKNNFSFSKFEKLINILQEATARFKGIGEVLKISTNLYGYDKGYKKYEGELYLKANLNKYGEVIIGVDEKGEKIKEKIYFNSFAEKLKYIRLNTSSKGTDSNIINTIIYNYYTTIPYSCMPIVNIFFDLIDADIIIECDNNIRKSFEEFRKKYNSKIIGLKNYDKLTEIEKKVVNRLVDYGVIIQDRYLIVIGEISNRLNARFSTYDIRLKILEISKEMTHLSKIASEIFEKYFN